MTADLVIRQTGSSYPGDGTFVVGPDFAIAPSLSAVNVGDSISGAFWVRVVLSADLVVSDDDAVMGAFQFAGLRSGQTSDQVNFTNPIPKGLRSGVYNLLFEVDSRNDVQEVSETNNWTYNRDRPYIVGSTTLADTQSLFASYGRLGLMAKLAQAAYHLQPWENEDTKRNDIKVGATEAFQALSADLRFLTATDLPTVAYESFDSPWRGGGLLSGTYIHDNAAAIVARSSDALFLSFRGTNDNDAGHASPDELHWGPMARHLDKFDLLIEAIKDYLSEHGEIKRVFVTGHSLGAGMVEGLAQAYAEMNNGRLTFAGCGIDFQTFASPGFSVPPVAPQFEDRGMKNLWINRDIIELAAIAGRNTGDKNEIYHDIPATFWTASLHGAGLYAAFADALLAEGISTKELSGTALHGINYNRVYVHVAGNPAPADITLAMIGGDDDDIKGSIWNDIILGMAGADTLKGSDGRDHLQGGAGSDTLFGGQNSDYLFGGSSADMLHGGLGRDELTGNGGADVFVFQDTDIRFRNGLLQDASGLSDSVRDFQKRVDKIDLSLIDTRLLKFGDQAFDYLGLGGFTKERGQVRWEWSHGNTLVQGDLDGNGRADFTITLLGEVSLLKGDFLL